MPILSGLGISCNSANHCPDNGHRDGGLEEMGGHAVGTIGKGQSLLPSNLFPICNILWWGRSLSLKNVSRFIVYVSSCFMFHHVSSLVDWSNQRNMMKQVTSTCCINIHSACPSAAPARLPIARPEELTVLSQIFSFQLDRSMSRSVTNVMFQNHPDSFRFLHSVSFCHLHVSNQTPDIP